MTSAIRTEIKPPPHAIHGRQFHVWLADDGVVWQITSENADVTLDDMNEVAEAIREASGGVKRPMVLDARGMRSVTKEARVRSDEVVPDLISASAIVVGSPLTRMLATFYLKLRTSRVPMAVFDDPQRAAQWARDRV